MDIKSDNHIFYIFLYQQAERGFDAAINCRAQNCPTARTDSIGLGLAITRGTPRPYNGRHKSKTGGRALHVGLCADGIGR